MVSSAGHSYHTPLLPSCATSVSFFEQIPRLSDTDRGRGKKEGQRLGMKELPVFRERMAAGKRRQVSVLPTCCYLAHAHPTMFYIHLVLGLHNFQHSVGRTPSLHTYTTTPMNFLPYSLPLLHITMQSHPLLTPSSLPFSPSPLHLSILILSAITDNSNQLVRSAFNQTLYTQLITRDYRRDYCTCCTDYRGLL